MSVAPFSFHPASRVSILDICNPWQMAFTTAQVTEVLDEPVDSELSFVGIANGPGNVKRTFGYAYRRADTVKVGRRRLTDEDHAALLKNINESRRAKQSLRAAKEFHCQIRKGRPIL